MLPHVPAGFVAVAVVVEAVAVAVVAGGVVVGVVLMGGWKVSTEYLKIERNA